MNGGRTIVSCGLRGSSGRGCAMTGSSIRSEEAVTAPVVDGGETTSGLLAKPGGAPASTADFSEQASGRATQSWGAVGPIKLLEAGKGSGRSMDGPSRRKSLLVIWEGLGGGDGAGRRRNEPTQANTQHGRFARRGATRSLT